MNTWRKGSRWRKQVQDYLTGLGFDCRATEWREPGDDITAQRGDRLRLSVEAKNERAITLAEYVKQAENNAARWQVPIVFIHRRGRSSVDDGYVVMTGAAFAQLLRQTD